MGRVGLVRSLARSFVRSFVRSYQARHSPTKHPGGPQHVREGLGATCCSIQSFPLLSILSLVLPCFLRFPLTSVTCASFLLSSSASSLPFLPPPVLSSFPLSASSRSHPLITLHPSSLLSFQSPAPSFVPLAFSLPSSCASSLLHSFLLRSFLPSFVAPSLRPLLPCFLPPFFPSVLPAVLPSVLPSSRLSFFLRVARPPNHPSTSQRATLEPVCLSILASAVGSATQLLQQVDVPPRGAP